MAEDAPVLYWSCWICCAAGGYDHNSENSYAGDISNLLHADRMYLQHKLEAASSEIEVLVHGAASNARAGLSLKDLVRGKQLEHLRGSVTGFGIFRIASYFETPVQCLNEEEEIMLLGFFAYDVCYGFSSVLNRPKPL